MTDLPRKLRDSKTQCRAVDRSLLLEEAAREIERIELENVELRLALEAISGASMELASAARIKHVTQMVDNIKQMAAHFERIRK